MKKFLNRFKTKDFWLRVICGVCFGLAFPPINLYPLIYIGIILLIKEIITCNSYNEVLRKTYAIFFWFNLVAVSWLCLSGFRHNADRFLIVAGVLTLIAHPMFFWLPAAAFYKVYRSLKNFRYKYLYLLSFPFIWVAFEYLHTQTQLSFPWLTFGNSQTYNLAKIQFIEYTGVYGLTFWICTVGILLFYFAQKQRAARWQNFNIKSYLLIILIIVVYLAPDAYTFIMKSPAKYSNAFTNGEVNVGVVQPNGDPWEKWGSKQMQFVNEYTDMIKTLKDKNPKTELIILPETAITFLIFQESYKEKYLKFKNLVDSINTPLLIGLPYVKFYKDSLEAPPDAKRGGSGNFYDTYNAAALFEKNKTPQEYQIYKKNKLVIGAERIPYQETLGFLKDFVTWGVGISQWQIGKDTVNFVMENGVQFNTAICYESVYPEYFSKFVKKGADFCTIITNDAWWGKLFGTYQHNQFAILRAVENRRWIARSANTGISDFIDPYGNKYEETEINTRASFAGKIGIIKEKTFYTEHGDLFSVICLWISSGAVLACFVIGFIKQKSRS
ncbi:MAG: apolipoprotein N-acyltransferase [Bacteroidetes bacterium]|nr:apolipoprotein N-acyltransferase [Bacteroidota bacterium]